MNTFTKQLKRKVYFEIKIICEKKNAIEFLLTLVIAFKSGRCALPFLSSDKVIFYNMSYIYQAQTKPTLGM